MASNPDFGSWTVATNRHYLIHSFSVNDGLSPSSSISIIGRPPSHSNSSPNLMRMSDSTAAAADNNTAMSSGGEDTSPEGKKRVVHAQGGNSPNSSKVLSNVSRYVSKSRV
jgi:hypothetical protein